MLFLQAFIYTVPRLANVTLSTGEFYEPGVYRTVVTSGVPYCSGWPALIAVYLVAHAHQIFRDLKDRKGYPPTTMKQFDTWC